MERKPSKGYAWQCPKCLKAANSAQGDMAGLGSTSPGIGASSANGLVDYGVENGIPNRLNSATMVPSDHTTATLADESAAESSKPERKRKHIWPFHYLGDYSRLDAVDGKRLTCRFSAISRHMLMSNTRLEEEDDKGFPKARSRLGDKYQAEILPFGDEGETADGIALDDSIQSQPQPRSGNRGRKKQPPKKIRIEGNVKEWTLLVVIVTSELTESILTCICHDSFRRH